jgi:hypothetical protein
MIRLSCSGPSHAYHNSKVLSLASCKKSRYALKSLSSHPVSSYHTGHDYSLKRAFPRSAYSELERRVRVLSSPSCNRPSNRLCNSHIVNRVSNNSNSPFKITAVHWSTLRGHRQLLADFFSIRTYYIGEYGTLESCETNQAGSGCRL